jgi:glycosyltransferase involved in cell wall biosynthesis
LKILCICCLWESFREVLYEGNHKPNGMTGSYRVLKGLIEYGHKVDYIFYSYFSVDKKRVLNIASDFVNINSIKDIIYFGKLRSFLKFFSYLKGAFLLRRSINRILKKEKYDFVFGQGPTADVVAGIVRKYNIPYGSRRFGDHFYNLIRKKGYIYACLSHPFEYYSYKVKKSFMIGTNDGSGLYKSLKLILKNKVPPYDFYHLINGVDKLENYVIADQDLKKKKLPYLLYVARITQWKKQELAIEIVRLLKEKGINIKLYLAGQKDISSKYYDKLLKIIEYYKVVEQVKYLGVISHDQVYRMAASATACLSLYDICNLGNVFLEYLAAGGVIISRNDGSLDDLIIDGENGFLVDSMEQAAEIVMRLINEPDLYSKIKINAINTANKKILSWKDRVDFEIKLIEKTVKEYKIN